MLAIKTTNDSVNKVLLVNIQLLQVSFKHIIPLTWQTLANTVINASSNAVVEHNFISRQNDKNTPVWPYSWRLHQASQNLRSCQMEKLLFRFVSNIHQAVSEGSVGGPWVGRLKLRLSREGRSLVGWWLEVLRGLVGK